MFPNAKTQNVRVWSQEMFSEGDSAGQGGGSEWFYIFKNPF